MQLVVTVILYYLSLVHVVSTDIFELYCICLIINIYNITIMSFMLVPKYSFILVIMGGVKFRPNIILLNSLLKDLFNYAAQPQDDVLKSFKIF